jgi:RNA polymerase sigma-70 factor (ECF subfamily)
MEPAECMSQTGRQFDFEALANQHKDAIYRQMLRACGNREDAEDVLIEALLRAYQHLDSLRAAESFRGWLAIIARRVCSNLQERERLQPLLRLTELEEKGHDLASPAPAMEEQMDARYLQGVLREAVKALPPRLREVYQRRDMEEQPGEQVAAELNISLAAMKSRLHRARLMVRQRLDEALLGQRKESI